MLTNPLDKNNWWKKYQRRVDSEGLEDKGGDEEEREQVQEEEEEEEEEHLEDDEAPGAFLPGLLLLSLFHHRGCVARKSHAHDSSSQILQSKKLLKVHLSVFVLACFKKHSQNNDNTIPLSSICVCMSAI